MSRSLPEPPAVIYPDPFSIPSFLHGHFIIAECYDSVICVTDPLYEVVIRGQKAVAMRSQFFGVMVTRYTKTYYHDCSVCFAEIRKAF